MITLPDREAVIFDLETTDTAVAEAAGTLPSPVEIGAVRVTADLEEVAQFQALIQPPNLDAFTELSQRLTGIHPAELERAKPWADQWRDFAEFTDFNRVRLYSWGTHFDIPVLKLAYSRSRLGYPHHLTPVCVLGWVTGFCAQWGISPGRWDLKTVARRFGVELGKRHRGLPDAQGALDVLRAVANFEDEL